jgi:hypothetical protein
MLKAFPVLYFIVSIFCNYPQMPKKFKQTFTENQKLLVWSGNTSGTLYYNWEKQLYRIDRDNGKFDRYCGTIYKMKNTPCSHYVKNGNRYIYFPDKKYCCKCCTKENGCGILKYNWLENAKKIQDFAENDEEYEVWKASGDQDNFVTNIKRNKEIVKIEQVSSDTIFFDSTSMSMDFDDEVFDLPDLCREDKNCGMFNICGLLN